VGAVVVLVLCASRVVITEVMANPRGSTGAHGPEDRNEFVELYNPTGRAVDLHDWTLDDGDSKDRIVAWCDSAILADSRQLLIGTTWLLPGHYAVILDSEYTDPNPVGDWVQPYHLGDRTLVLTTGNTTLGNGLAGTDPVVVCSPYGDTTTFGTPFDPADGFPRDAGDGLSWERVRVDEPDAPDNWAVCPDTAGCTPGDTNATASCWDLTVVSVVPADSASPQPAEPFSIVVRVENRGYATSDTWSLRAWLDRNASQRRDPAESVAELAGDPLLAGRDTNLAFSFGCPPSRTDLWVELSCPGDRDTIDNASRLAIVPGGMHRLLNLVIGDFSPDGDGFEDSLPIVLRLPEAHGRLRVEVFDLAGRCVRILTTGSFRPETEDVCLHWDGRRQDGERLPAAVYAVRARYEYAGRVVGEKLPVVLVR